MQQKIIHLLIVEDNPGDVRLLKEAFKESKLHHQIHVVMDGQAALDFLNQKDNPKPHLILLNLNLPRKTGHEVLEAVKQDAVLRRIPIIVLSSSAATTDIGRAYDLHANCFIQKPTDLDEFLNVMRVIEDFWMRLAKLPPEDAARTSSPQNRQPVQGQ
jgi:chemotaxis family two-component system response regulator Rcp1